MVCGHAQMSLGDESIEPCKRIHFVSFLDPGCRRRGYDSTCDVEAWNGIFESVWLRPEKLSAAERCCANAE